MDPDKSLAVVANFIASMLLGVIALNLRQAYRPIFLAGLIYFGSLSLRHVSDAPFGVWGRQVFATFTIIYMSHMSCVLCIEKYTLPKRPGVTLDWVGGYNMLFNARWIGTYRQTPDIKTVASSEKAPQAKSKDSSGRLVAILFSPRAIFLRNRALSIAGTLVAEQLFRYCYVDLPSHYNAELDETDFLPIHESYFRRLGEVTLRETAIRAWLVVFYIFYSVFLFKAVHDALALFFVGVRINNPEDWPPLFGDIREATSLRNFWGKFSHKLVYRSFTAYGIWISKNILRFPRTSFVGKLFINCFVFAMSGTIHAVALYQLGYTCGVWQELQFYMLHFLGTVLELVVTTVFSKLMGGQRLNFIVRKILGYAWVFMFLFTILPKSQYPRVFCAPDLS